MAFLRDYLPRRYALGSGQVIAPDGRTSKQCDIVIFDPLDGPHLPVGDRHALFPIEVVYGVVEVKSALTADELASAYANIQSVKELAPTGTMLLQLPGLAMGVARPMPFGAVFAYGAPRSLGAISEQVRLLDAGLGEHVPRRPDAVVVLDAGIVAPFPSPRATKGGDLPNRYEILDRSALAATRPTGRHTLLRFYLDLLSDLRTIELQKPELRSYIDTPEWVDGHIVAQRLVVRSPGGVWNPDAPVSKLSSAAIRKLLELAQGVELTTYGDYLQNMFPGPLDVSRLPKADLQRPVHIYNPTQKTGPLLDVTIDGVPHLVDTEALQAALQADPYVVVPGINAAELFAFSGPISQTG